MDAHVSYRGQSHIYRVPEDASVASLKALIHENLQLPPTQQKLLCRGKQLRDEESVPRAKMMLLGTPAQLVSAVSDSLSHHASLTARRAEALTHAPHISRTARVHDLHTSQTLIHRVSVLPLPDSHRSLEILQRLMHDAAIEKLMRRNDLVIGHLTELDPRTNTSHDSKLLGLNRNAGQEILLRLRTDDLGGWRDYRSIRSVLCHELVHNTFGDHDRRFWDLFKTYSKQVAEAESGRSLGMEEVYIPSDGESVDHGTSWTGGTHVLGSRDTSIAPSPGEMSVRERRARAAEERSKRTNG